MQTCPECNKKIEKNLVKCPNCGYPLMKQTNNIKSNNIIDSNILGLASLIISIILIINLNTHNNAYKILFIAFPIFIIANYLKEKQIIKTKIPLYISAVASMLYLGFEALIYFDSFRQAIKFFLNDISVSYLALLIQIITKTLICIIIGTMILSLLNNQDKSFIKNNIKSLYIINLILILFYIISVSIQAFQYNMPNLILSILLYASFDITFSTYIKQLNQKEVE